MMTEPKDAQLPADLREQVRLVADRSGVAYDWLVNLYRAGFAAKLGATGERPYGDLGGGDQGELRAAIATDVKNGVLRIEFGKPVAWLALPAAHARQLARMLLEGAKALEKRLP